VVLRVLHLNRTKQASLAHILVQVVHKLVRLEFY